MPRRRLAKLLAAVAAMQAAVPVWVALAVRVAAADQLGLEERKRRVAWSGLAALAEVRPMRVVTWPVLGPTPLRERLAAADPRAGVALARAGRVVPQGLLERPALAARSPLVLGTSRWRTSTAASWPSR